MAVIRIDPPLRLATPRGMSWAHFLVDYGLETDFLWVCFLDDTGECWSFPNPQVRAGWNYTAGRYPPDYVPHEFAQPAKPPNKPK